MLFPLTGEANPMLQKLYITNMFNILWQELKFFELACFKSCQFGDVDVPPPPPSWPGHQIGARPGDLKKKHGFCWTWEISCLLDMDTWLVVRFEDLKLLRPIFQVLFFLLRVSGSVTKQVLWFSLTTLYSIFFKKTFLQVIVPFIKDS